MRINVFLAAALVACGVGVLSADADQPAPKVDPLISRGRYLVVIGACNDCHTPRWRTSDGNVPVASWMVGSDVGLRAAWGTEYPVNVRRWFQEISEQQWLFAVKTRGGKMQWHDMRHLTLDDQRAIYRFIHSLGPKGEEAPQDVAPELEPTTPYVDLRLHMPAPTASGR